MGKQMKPVTEWHLKRLVKITIFLTVCRRGARPMKGEAIHAES